MKNIYLYSIIIIFFLNGCSNEKTIQRRENWLDEKVSQLRCGDSIRINEICYSYVAKRLRKDTANIVFANKSYSVKKLNESVYVLHGKDSLLLRIDKIFVGVSRGVIREMVIDIKKLCR